MCNFYLVCGLASGKRIDQRVYTQNVNRALLKSLDLRRLLNKPRQSHTNRRVCPWRPYVRLFGFVDENESLAIYSLLAGYPTQPISLMRKS